MRKLLVLVLIGCSILSTLATNSSVHAASVPNSYPPDYCLTVSISITNVRTVPLPLGSGRAYNAAIGVTNFCGQTLDSGGYWSAASTVYCPDTQAGFYQNGGVPALSSGAYQLYLDRQGVAFCQVVDNGVVVSQYPPDSVTVYSGAFSSYTVSGRVIQAKGTKTASFS